jgi:pSer/pThr/pTyr-binding forkhead associated (FHA) protein
LASAPIGLTLPWGRIMTEKLGALVLGSEDGAYSLTIAPRAQLTVGRSQDLVDFVIDERTISRKHARIRHTGAECFVEDEGSKVGTFVNETRVEGPVAIHPGDRVRIGKVVLIVSARPASASG